jgi:hypothetical protein
MVSDEPIRFYKFARLHGLDSRELLENCHRAGIPVMNQLSMLARNQRRAIEALIRRGDGGPPSSHDGPSLGPVPAGTGPKPPQLQAAATPQTTRQDVVSSA